jgi:hypothetical protein
MPAVPGGRPARPAGQRSERVCRRSPSGIPPLVLPDFPSGSTMAPVRPSAPADAAFLLFPFPPTPGRRPRWPPGGAALTCTCPRAGTASTVAHPLRSCLRAARRSGLTSPTQVRTAPRPPGHTTANPETHHPGQAAEPSAADTTRLQSPRGREQLHEINRWIEAHRHAWAGNTNSAIPCIGMGSVGRGHMSPAFEAVATRQVNSP